MTNETTKKSLILLRGLPGSGKSTLAELLSEQGKYPIYSIDNYFINSETGAYVFEYQNNHRAYKACEDNTRNAMEQGVEKIFVDNTFTLEWEIEPYMKLASQYGYHVHVLTVENRHGGKNIHGVTDEQVEKMAARYKVMLYSSSGKE